MKLAEAIEAEESQALAATGACKLERVRRGMDDQSAVQLGDLIDDPESYPAPAVARILLRVEHSVSPSTIRSHRAGNCPCYLGRRAAA